MDQFLAELPKWAGTAPQWVVAAAVITALLKLVPVWRQQSMDKEKSDIDGYRKEVGELRDALKECQEECEQATKQSRAEIRALHEELWGLRKQHIAEQIGLINVILKTVDAPELRGFLAVLESVKDQLAVHEMLSSEGTDVQGA